jgi:hypothetical protein
MYHENVTYRPAWDMVRLNTQTGIGHGASEHPDRYRTWCVTTRRPVWHMVCHNTQTGMALQTRLLNPTAQSEEAGQPGTGIRLPSHRYRSRCRSVNPRVHIHVTSRCMELHLHSSYVPYNSSTQCQAVTCTPQCSRLDDSKWRGTVAGRHVTMQLQLCSKLNTYTIF